MKAEPYFRKKGKFKNNRMRVIIEWVEDNGDVKSRSIPKPKKLLEILDRQICPKCMKEIPAKNTPELNAP